MTAWIHRRLFPTLTLLLIVTLFAPLAPAARAQDGVPPADSPVDVAEPSATEAAPSEPAPEATDPPGAPEEPAPAAPEAPAPVATENAPGEPAPVSTEALVEPAAPAAEMPVPTDEPTVVQGTGNATEVPTPGSPDATTEPETSETSALSVESSLTVAVTDAVTAAPIAGAAVVVYDESWTQVASSMTDASGIVAVGALAEGWYHLEAAADGYHSGQWYSQWVSGPAELSLALQSLPSAGALTVRVVDQQTGAPLPGASVVVRGYWSGVDVASGTTSVDGTFVTPDLPGGEYGVSVTAAQYLDGSFYALVNGSAEITAPLQLTPLPGTLTIHVVDEATGDPIAGASVVVRNPSIWDVVASGATDANGAFVTGELAAALYWVDVSADVYLGSGDYVAIDGAVERTYALQLAPLPGSLTIHVVDQVTGLPITGATVGVWANGYITGITDASGTFTIDELPGGTYSMEVSAEGYFAQSGNPSVNGPTEFMMSLKPILPGTLTVTVVDAISGEPIAGAAVSVTWPDLVSGTTDPDGIYVTPELSSGNHRVEASANGYHPGFAYAWLNGPTEFTLQLTPMQSGALSVRVVDGMSGSPITDATVVVRDGPSQEEVVVGTTDSEGVFITGELPGGAYEIELTADRYLPNGGLATVDGPTNVLLWMQSSIAGTLTVSVVDTEAFRPIQGASVTVMDSDSGEQVFAGSTDDAGTIVADSLEVGSVDIIVTASGFDPVQVPTYLGNQDNRVFISLQPQAGTLTVHVTDQASGSPVAGAVVRIIGQGPEGWTEIANGVTDSSGTYVSPELAGDIYYVEASADGYFGGAANMYLAGDTLGTLPLEPRIAGEVTVAVVDAISGEPIHKASISVNDFSLSGPVSGMTNNKGIFVTGTLPGAWYRLEVHADGYENAVRDLLVSGPTEITVALEPQAPGNVAITVVDQVTGEPVADAMVEVRDGDTGTVVGGGKTKKGGDFTTKELPSGNYSIEVEADGYYPGWANPWINGDTAITVSMYPSLPGTLTVTALDQATGAPIPGAEVVITNPLDGTQVAGTTDANGVFVTGTLAAGEYSMDVTADGYLPSRNLYIVINGAAEQPVGLPPAVPGALTVNVMNQSTWQPIPGATVTVRDSWTAGLVATGVTDAIGYLVFPELPGGDYVLHAAAEGYALTGLTYLQVSGPASVTLWMIPGEPGALTLSVFDNHTGMSIPGANVVVRDGSGGEMATGTTDGEGSFITGELPPGIYRIDLTAARYHPSSDQHAVVNGSNSAWLGMTLRTAATLSLSVDAGTPGMKVSVTGSGFQPGEIVTLAWRDPDGIVLATTKAKSDGTIAASITIPDTYPSWHRVIAVGQESEAIGASNLIVTVPATP